MRFINRILWKVLAAIHFDAPVKLLRRSALLDDGWFRSYRTKEAIDKDGNAIPWCTYPFLHFIEPRLKPTFRVFEYGCGNSTIWYAKKVLEIIAVEHDSAWAEKIAANLPANAKLVFKALDDGYAQEIRQHGLFDIIVIDGRNRIQCVQGALQTLKPDGVIFWDNSNREDFAMGYKFPAEKGFSEISFDGMGPINIYSWRTSILYRNENLLGI